jgi:hypothetical protein
MGFVKDNEVISGASGDVGTLWSFRQRAGKFSGSQILNGFNPMPP